MTATTFIRLAAAALLVVRLVAGAAEAQEDRVLRLRFPPGQSSALVKDTLRGHDTVSYRLSASAGQVMQVALLASNAATYFNIYAPGRGPGDAALVRSDTTGSLVPNLNQAKVTLPDSGDYTINVYLYRAAARRGERSDFALTVSVRGTPAPPQGGTATQLPGGAPATGDAGPWRVTGLAAGDRLNQRSGPGTGFPVIASFVAGEILDGHGCMVNGAGGRWCEVSRPGPNYVRGWVSARYLTPARPSDAGVATQLPEVAPLPPSAPNATGAIRCAPYGGQALQSCTFGVYRRGGGNGTLAIRLPRGGERRIEFEAGRPVSSNSRAGIYAEWGNREVTVMIGTEERYVVPDAVIWGG